ncbi:alkaline phosphatase family protein [Chloroflexota bacterium]
MNNGDNKVLVIGLDGATWEVVAPLADEGKLPALRKLMQEGAYGDLESTMPPNTPSAWTSIFTGVNAGKHSLFCFVKRKEGSYFIKPISSRDKKVKSIWHILSEQGRRVILMNIPCTYPVDKVNGIMISGLGTPSRSACFTYPPKFKQKLLREFPNYDVDFNEDLILLSSDKSFILDKIKFLTAEQISVAKHLFETEPWHLFTIVFRSTDLIQHYYWNDKETIFEYYRQIDEFLQWSMSNMDRNTTLLVCSDHGFSGVNTRVCLNNWLHEIGLLQLNRPTNTLWKKLLPSAETVQRLLAKFGLRNLAWRLKRSRLLEVVVKHLVPSEDLQYLFNVDWSRTKAYFWESSGGIISVNLKGREPQGIVEEAEFDTIREQVIKEALQLKDPKISRNIINHACRGEEEYHGESPDIPDVILLPNKGYRLWGAYNKSGNICEDEVVRIGDHRRNGILAAYGGQVRPGGRIEGARVYDVTPTILRLLGIPVPSYMDGKTTVEVSTEETTNLKPDTGVEQRRIRDRITRLKH